MECVFASIPFDVVFTLLTRFVSIKELHSLRLTSKWCHHIVYRVAHDKQIDFFDGAYENDVIIKTLLHNIRTLDHSFPTFLPVTYEFLAQQYKANYWMCLSIASPFKDFKTQLVKFEKIGPHSHLYLISICYITNHLGEIFLNATVGL